jgi:NAD(P)-dependent dehydrogenase (short-subunit alcohol dehydrogenase family)
MSIRDSLLKLNDKTVAIVGPFNSTNQMMLTLLSEQGADVALVGKETPEARRYTEHLTDQREIYPHHGRAGVISTRLDDPKEARDIVARIVHSFGRLDTLVDTLPSERTDLSLSREIAQESLKFLTSRPRSRMIWLTQHRDLDSQTPSLEVRKLRDQLTLEYGPKGLTANELVIGVSEEYLLRKAPKGPSIKATLTEVKAQMPRARLVDPSEIASWVMFLASPLSQALNGHSLYIDHGLSSD